MSIQAKGGGGGRVQGCEEHPSFQEDFMGGGKGAAELRPQFYHYISEAPPFTGAHG